MKTLGRILIILAAFAIVMGITYVAVNVAGGSSSTGMPQFQGGERPALPNGQFEMGERPAFPGSQFGERPEGRERGGGGWMFGLIKNISIVAVVVTLIALTKSIIQKKKRSTRMLVE